jgi:hypothetical protein
MLLILRYRLIGGVLIIGGFYIVIYAQKKERRSQRDALDQKYSYTKPGGLLVGNRKQSNLEEPLLS